jgi:hypothetical protein
VRIQHTLRTLAQKTEDWLEPTSRNRGAPSAGLFLLSILLAALAFSTWQTLIAFHSPMYRGDEGARILGASFPIVKMGNRVWLPVLQTQIWVLYLLRVPSIAFRAIPVFYFFLSLASLGLLGWKLLGRSRSSLVFLLLLLASFASQRNMVGLGHSLMQEMVGIPLFFLLLAAGALELRKRWWIPALAAVAMLTRDSFWFYLVAFTVLNLPAVLRDRETRRAVLAVWAAPVLWMLMIPPFILAVFHRLPSFPLEWPLMINKDSGQVVSRFSEGGASLWTAMVESKALVLIATFAIVGVLVAANRRNSARTGGAAAFSSRFVPFSLLSLAIVYLLIFLFNPWEATGGSIRIAVPFLEHAFVWAILLFDWARGLPTWRLAAARGLLCAGLLLSINTDARRWRIPDEREIAASYARLHRALRADGGVWGKKSCFVFDDFWDELDRLAAPTMYSRHEFVERGQLVYPHDCDYLYLRVPVTRPLGSSYRRLGEFDIDGIRYALYSKH